MLIYIEGNIGSGKSTFVKLMLNHLQQLVKKGLNPRLIQEPVDEWMMTFDKDGKNILDKFYEDQTRWSFTFQMNSFISRAHKIQEKRDLKLDNQILFVERSIYTDRHCFAANCYESNKMTQLEYDIYCRWNDWLSTQFNLRPTAYIYLRCDTAVNVERIAKRSRQGECNIPVDYLDNLHNKHECWMKAENDKQVPVLTLDVSEDFTEIDKMNALFNQVDSFIDSLH